MYISVCWTHSDSVMVLSLQSRSMSNSILLECILLHICSSVWNFLNSKKITHHPKNRSFYMQHALLKRWWFTYPPHSKHHTTRNNDIWRYLKAVSNLNSCTHVNTILLKTRFGRCRYGTNLGELQSTKFGNRVCTRVYTLFSCCTHVVHMTCRTYMYYT